MVDEAFKTKDVVLVHGAFADGSSWSGVVERLQAARLHVVSVQNPLTSLEEDVKATKRVLAMQDGPTCWSVIRGEASSSARSEWIRRLQDLFTWRLPKSARILVQPETWQRSFPRRLRVHLSILPMALRNWMKKHLSGTLHPTFRPLRRKCSQPHKARLSKPFSRKRPRSLHGRISRAGTPFRLWITGSRH